MVSSNKNLDQLKKRIKNLEYEYRQVRTKMASTGVEGAKNLQSNCTFYEELDNILGTQDAINHDCMTIRSFQGRSLPQLDQSQKREKTHHHPQVLILNSLAQVRPQMNHYRNRGKSHQRQKGKPPSTRERSQMNKMKGICDMWRISMEKQAERFNRSMELQQAAIQSQTEQTKAPVLGLKDILKDCLKSD